MTLLYWSHATSNSAWNSTSKSTWNSTSNSMTSFYSSAVLKCWKLLLTNNTEMLEAEKKWQRNHDRDIFFNIVIENVIVQAFKPSSLRAFEPSSLRAVCGSYSNHLAHREFWKKLAKQSLEAQASLRPLVLTKNSPFPLPGVQAVSHVRPRALARVFSGVEGVAVMVGVTPP